MNIEPIGADVFDYADLLIRARRNLKRSEEHTSELQSH